MLLSGLSPVAWNSSAVVASVDSLSQISVTASEYSDQDISFFKVGDVVDYVPTGDQDNATIGLEIDSISGNQITFTANHGIATAGGTIEPTTYANASSNHRVDAYLSNSNDLINSSVDAQEYS